MCQPQEGLLAGRQVIHASGVCRAPVKRMEDATGFTHLPK